MAAATADSDPARQERLTRRIRLLVAATIGYNAVEAVKEGRAAWHGESCCPVSAAPSTPHAEKAADACGCTTACSCCT